MWAIFQTNNAQTFSTKKTSKQLFLTSQLTKLQHIQMHALSIQQHIYYNLQKINKAKRQQQYSKKKKLEIVQIKIIENIQLEISKLFQYLEADSYQYKISVQYRDLQKINDHVFFKSTMKNYDDKRKLFNEYIFILETKMQELQYIQSHRTFRKKLENPNMDITVHKSQKIILPITYKTRQKYELSTKLNEQLKEAYKNRYQKLQKDQILSIQQYVKKFKYNSYQAEQVTACIINILGLMFFKEIANKKILETRLKALQKSFARLDACNKLVKLAIEKKQQAIEFLNRESLVVRPLNRPSKILYEKYLKSMNKQMESRFAQGINFTKPKLFRSKSWNNIINIEGKKSETYDQFLAQKSQYEISDAGDLTKSFLLHLQKLGLGTHSKKS